MHSKMDQEKKHEGQLEIDLVEGVQVEAKGRTITVKGEKGELTRTFKHIRWDGCMFPNATLQTPGTWNEILGAMISVRDAHGWSEA